MPIHGHTKIELTSQTTGEDETIEKDNIVTNAVSQIFNAFNGMALLREANANGEYGSTSDKSWELPESLYGGILLYDTALGSDPNTLFAPPEANLVGSGVPKVLNNGKGLQRGSFNARPPCPPPTAPTRRATTTVRCSGRRRSFPTRRARMTATSTAARCTPTRKTTRWCLALSATISWCCVTPPL